MLRFIFIVLFLFRFALAFIHVQQACDSDESWTKLLDQLEEKVKTAKRKRQFIPEKSLIASLRPLYTTAMKQLNKAARRETKMLRVPRKRRSHRLATISLHEEQQDQQTVESEMERQRKVFSIII